MIVNNVGYTQYVFQRLGAVRACPSWVPRAKQPSAQDTISASEKQETELRKLIRADNDEIKAAFGDHFTRDLGPGETTGYKLTTAIAEMHLGNLTNIGERFAGILYPSVRMSANGDNLALQPAFVDQHLEFVKATLVRIDKLEAGRFSITALDHATSFDNDGHLEWKGRLPRWTLRSGQMAGCELVTGRDEHGDYLAGSGQEMYWRMTDAKTGATVPLN